MSHSPETSKAIFFHETGGPEVLRWEDHVPGTPGPGEALVRHGAVGLNFIDVYHRTGLYPLPALPAIPGMEGAGTVEAVGEGVTELTGVRPGDRVAYAGNPVGAYAQRRLIPAHRLVALPDDIDFVTAAGMMLRGMTARYLLYGCYPVREGTTMLVHAAAGGVGSLVVPWARHLGATVIGTAGDEAKAQRALANGCQHVILYRNEDVAVKVRELTDGRGVDVVYDSVGQATFMASLDCLRPMGTLVSFGQSSGSVEPFSPSLLAAKGSLFLTRPSLMHYTAQRADLLAHARDLFDVVRAGIVQVQVNQTFPLEQAAEAHRTLESRRTTGSTVLLV
ncbi:quinone oxidoreductase [Nitratidesulfovibrio sp. HK-II]|uniref:quinone oxidoreductase family protein n=1 Tax=Nitratidesulfovibrio sp. HK-II TaxID=2009266 RepID=UPI000E2EC1C8|nr:quinone oxidoreductase [Nitratidesulfovibrio sp. HK-II]GBO95181.1 quinone oxidoreductase [Nitratidesulfovibrio sp. HK-II]